MNTVGYIETRGHLIEGLKCPLCGSKNVHYEPSRVLASRDSARNLSDLYMTSNKIYCASNKCDWEHIL